MMIYETDLNLEFRMQEKSLSSASTCSSSLCSQHNLIMKQELTGMQRCNVLSLQKLNSSKLLIYYKYETGGNWIGLGA